MPADLPAILDDLRAEQADLDDLVADADLDTATPAEGWSVLDTLGHLWFFDREATRALTDPDGFTASLADVYADPQTYLAKQHDEPRTLGGDLPAVWRRTRTDLLDALSRADPGVKVPWFGPPMSPASFATARLMEYWAHGQDIADGLGVTRRPTDRLRHICHLGFRTRGFSYVVRGIEPPTSPVYVVLDAPEGGTWTFGEPAAGNRVEGSALDFCLVVTQRRHIDDTALQITGEAAREWMSIAQAFAGGATTTDPARVGLPAP